jgi:hypothetical protein
MKESKFPPGWDQKRVQRVLKHYEQQTEEEALAEDEAAYGIRLKQSWRSRASWSHPSENSSRSTNGHGGPNPPLEPTASIGRR